MSEGNHDINYSAADIEKYWKGQLSAAEQHAIEKAALDDPLLADAMDGYEEKALAPAPVIAPAINELKKRLAERVAEKQSTPVIKFLWWKAAAVVIVFIGAGWLYTSINNKAKNEGFAKNDNLKKESPGTAKTDTNTITAAPATTTVTDTLHDLAVNNYHKSPAKNKIADSKEKDREAEAAPVVAATKPAAINRQEETAKRKDTMIDTKEVVAKLSAKKMEADKSVNADLPEQKARGIATEDYKANNIASLGRTKNFSNTFNGFVIDQSNKPVANAFIQIPNLNVATQTDKSGYFSFKAADTAFSASIASAGFETQNINLRNKATLNQIILKPVQNNLEEVVVQSNGAEKRKQSIANDVSIKILDAEPVIGWTAYNAYLEKNKKINDDVKNIHGTVVVSFDVRSKWLNNFKIEQSLDEDLDAEAIRLIKEGPAWKLLKGKKATATVIVKF